MKKAAAFVAFVFVCYLAVTHPETTGHMVTDALNFLKHGHF